MVALAGMLATQEVSRVRAEPVQLYTVDRHGRQESNIDFLVYSLTIVGSFGCFPISHC